MLKKIKENIHLADFPTLHNIVYYLLFKEIKDKDIWEKVIA